MITTDVLIVGGGLVGAAAALGLAKSGFDVVLLEPHPPQISDDWDARVYAVSPGNVAWLSKLGVWDRVPAARKQAITRMDVRGDTHGRICFDAYEAHAATLASIVENRQLQDAIWAGFAKAGVQVIAARPTAIDSQATQATCQLDNGQTVSARLVIAADGANSWTRQQAGITVNSKPYHQLGVVANFELSAPHFGTARQWFKQDSILAWLPLPGLRMSMVWAQTEAAAANLLALDAKAFCQQVRAAGFGEWGELSLITPPQAFPLRLSSAEKTIAERLVLVGDAAHTVHPLAGQGVNLGFRDVRELLSQIQARKHHEDIGATAFLRHYARSRAEDVLVMQKSCDGLQRLFNQAPSWLGPLRNIGLSAVNQSTWLKRQLIAQAMI